MIYIVSGVARSGKSLVMQMLDAGGIELTYDPNYLPANEFNKNGFFEYHNPDDLLSDPDFVLSIQGMAINVVAHQFLNLPWRLHKNAKVLWIDRDLRAVYESQTRVNRKTGDRILDFEEFIHITSDVIYRAKYEMRSYYDHMIFSYEDILHRVGYPLELTDKMYYFLDDERFNPINAAGVVEKEMAHDADPEGTHAKYAGGKCVSPETGERT